MPTANEKLAAALDELRRLQEDGSRVFASEQLTRTSRERLVKHGFLQEVMKGWLMSASPTALPGDTTRSEEHTSELQSRGHLVCRLLLEKKKPERRCRRFSLPARSGMG